MRSWMIAFLGGWYFLLMLGHYLPPSLFAIKIIPFYTLAASAILAVLMPAKYYLVNTGIWPLRGAKSRKYHMFVGFFILGMAGAFYVLCNTIYALPPQLKGAVIEISGAICHSHPSIATGHEKNQPVQVVSFCATKIHQQEASPHLSDDVVTSLTHNPLKLSCYYCDIKLLPSHLYRLKIKLKFKRPLLNFHDVWPWQKQWRLPWVAKGSIRQVVESQALTPLTDDTAGKAEPPGVRPPDSYFQKANNAMKRWAHYYRVESTKKLVDFKYGYSMAALVFGDRSGLAVNDWLRLSNAGLTHLLVISGLHIGYIVLVLLFLTRAGLKCLARKWRVVVSLFFVLVALTFYLAVIDYGVPAVRASLVAVFALLLGVYRVRLLPSTALIFALLVCSLFDPFAFVSKGFWLSFLGVGILLMLFSHRPWQTQEKILGLWRVQVGFFLGLAGVLLWSFDQIPVTSVISNMIAVPIISLLLPLTLLATLINLVFEPLAVILLGLADHLFAFFWQVVDFGDQIPSLSFGYSHGAFAWLLILLAVPSMIHFRLPFAAGLILVAVLAFNYGLKKFSSPFSLLFLDVGQGSAVVLQTKGQPHHEPVTLLYDTGPAYPNWDAGKQIVIPALKEKQVQHLDLVAVSHDDKDHSGGLGAVLEQYPKARQLSGQAERLLGSEPCLAGHFTKLGGLEVRMLWPVKTPENYLSAAAAKADNNHSCVLKLTYQNLSVLLAGDIEVAAQQALMKRLQEKNNLDVLQSDILFLPHHGSKNAFYPNFLAKVKPQIVVASSGYNNSYGHPHRLFRNWFENRDIPFFNTGEQGAIEIILEESLSSKNTKNDSEVVGLKVRTASRSWFWQSFRWSSPYRQESKTSAVGSVIAFDQVIQQ